jgi:hypothetical protein
MPRKCAKKLRREYGQYVASMSDDVSRVRVIAALRAQRSSPAARLMSSEGGEASGARWVEDVTPLQCPQSIRHFGLQEERATCPWQRAATYEANRYPSVLPDVRCICEHCLHDGPASIKHGCEKVAYPVPVFQLTDCDACTYDVVDVYVGEGCTCAGRPLNLPPTNIRGSWPPL